MTPAEKAKLWRLLTSGWPEEADKVVSALKQALEALDSVETELGRAQRERYDYYRMERNASFAQSWNAALLADIAEALGGPNAEGLPSILQYPHASWVISPMNKPEEQTFVEWCLAIRKKPSDDAKNTEWRTFLAKLKRRAKP